MKAVSRSYKAGDNEILALDKADLNIEEGDLVVILGPSGAGKSTLLNLYTPERLSELMGSAGFTGVEIYRDEKKPWITVVGWKE